MTTVSAGAATTLRDEANLDAATRRELLDAVCEELMFAAYFLVATVYAFEQRLWAAIPFLAMYWIGFAAIAVGATDAFAAYGARET